MTQFELKSSPYRRTPTRHLGKLFLGVILGLIGIGVVGGSLRAGSIASSSG